MVVTEIKPARRAVHGIYSIEDDARLPGLSEAIERDMRAAMVESVDRAVFNGDGGANENTADVVGLQAAGITEATLSQANKIKADEVLKFFLAYVMGSMPRVWETFGLLPAWALTCSGMAVSTTRRLTIRPSRNS